MTPIFVFGALRSGTTVFRLMLDSHEDISNPGEVDVVFDHVHRDSSRDRWFYDVNALLLDRAYQAKRFDVEAGADGKEVARNFIAELGRNSNGRLTLNVHRNLQKIAAIFPNAKIIHLIRDPRDVARSSIGMGWAGTTYYGIEHWLETEYEWNTYASLFDKQNILELRFEDLILHPREQLERICGFIGVPFSPEMLNYHTRSTYEAPDASAIQQWKKKQRPREIALVEIKAKDLLLERKYELSGYPLTPPGLLETISLFCSDKKNKWKFERRRYGFLNFAMEKLTRRFAKPLHPIFLRRIHEIARQYDK